MTNFVIQESPVKNFNKVVDGMWELYIMRTSLVDDEPETAANLDESDVRRVSVSGGVSRKF